MYSAKSQHSSTSSFDSFGRLPKPSSRADFASLMLLSFFQAAPLLRAKRDENVPSSKSAIGRV
jgi:hypothetical protein